MRCLDFKPRSGLSVQGLGTGQPHGKSFLSHAAAERGANSPSFSEETVSSGRAGQMDLFEKLWYTSFCTRRKTL